MNLCLIGGVFDKSDEFRTGLRMTPETILQSELSERGFRVTVAGHLSELPLGQFEVVHVHHFGRGALRAALTCERAAFVFTSHDGGGLCGLPRPWIRRFGDQVVMRSADAIVSLSEAEREYQRRRYGAGADLHVVIPNGVDCAVYDLPPADRVPRREKQTILFVGQLIPLKRVDVLLQAVSLLGDDLSLRLVYQVDTTEGELKALANSLGIADRVEFLGPREPQDLRELYWGADVLALPSAAESQPSVVSEALLCGVPVVASDLPGIREHVGEYVELVPPGDPTLLSHALQRLLGKEGPTVERRWAGYKHALERFSISRMVEEHVRLYRAAVEAARVGKRNKWLPRGARWALEAGLSLT